jgi:hypothetical protein
MHSRNVIARLTIVALTALFLGCSATGQAEVRGKVSLDGQPVEDGTISFIPKTGSQNQAAWAPIKAGEFVVDGSQGLAIGASRVEIRAPRRTGKILPSSMGGTEPEYEMQEAIPPRYNSASQLTAEVKPGANELNFDLKSK